MARQIDGLPRINCQIWKKRSVLRMTTSFTGVRGMGRGRGRGIREATGKGPKAGWLASYLLETVAYGSLRHAQWRLTGIHLPSQIGLKW